MVIVNKRRQKRYNFLNNKYKGMSVFMLVIALVFLFWIGINAYNSINDERNIRLMRDGVRAVIAEIKVVNGAPNWKDTSYCTVYNPRLFGEKTRYSCDVSYETVRTVNDKDAMDAIIASYQSVLEKSRNINISDEVPLTLIRDSDTYTGKYRQMRAFNFTLLSTNTDKCSINYDLNALVVGYSLDINIKCYQDTQRAYFESIQYI